MNHKKERKSLTGSFGRKGKVMRLIGSLISVCIFLCVLWVSAVCYAVPYPEPNPPYPGPNPPYPDSEHNNERGLIVLAGGTLKKKQFSITPTWEYKDNSGNRTTIRQRPFSLTPTYEWSDNHGNRGTIRKRPFSITPTWVIK